MPYGAQSAPPKASSPDALAHDLGQPIVALKLLLAALAPTLDRPSQRMIAADMRIAVDTMHEQLRAFGAGATAAPAAPVDLGQLLRRLAVTYGVQAAAKGLELRAVPCQLHVRSDAAALSRILGNVIDNATRHTDTGRVLIGARRRPNAVVVEVHDTGPGFDPAAGAGLGLGIVRDLASTLDHPVHIESMPGKGTRVSIELPRA